MRRVGVIESKHKPAIEFPANDFRHGADIMNKPFEIVKKEEYHGD